MSFAKSRVRYKIRRSHSSHERACSHSSLSSRVYSESGNTISDHFASLQQRAKQPKGQNLVGDTPDKSQRVSRQIKASRTMLTMKKETYKKMTGFLHSHPTQARIITTTNKIITYAIYIHLPVPSSVAYVSRTGATTLLKDESTLCFQRRFSFPQ